MKKGDCIKVACENVIENKEWLFCYAYVMGQGELTNTKILHAWNEFGNIVFDSSNGNSVVIRKEKYYEIAKIKEKDVTKQNTDEVLRLMLQTKTYGGWIPSFTKPKSNEGDKDV